MLRPLLVFIGLVGAGFAVDFGLDRHIQFILMLVLINMVLGMSLNLVNGITGQFSLGHAGFMAVGAYSSAFVTEQWWVHFGPVVGFAQIPFFFCMAIFAGLMAAVAGFLVGLPSLRLRGDYLAIVTLGFGEIIRVILLNTPAVGGARGMSGVNGPSDWDLGFMVLSRFSISFALAIFWVLVCFFVIHRLVRSSYGRAFLSVKNDELAAESMGIDTTRTKVRAFVIAGFFAGVAGSIAAHYVGYLNPPMFAFHRSVDAVIIVVLGGMGSLSGSLIAAVLITVIPELLRPLQEYTGADLRMVIYALCLILIMILRPQGLLGSKELPELWRKYVRS